MDILNNLYRLATKDMLSLMFWKSFFQVLNHTNKSTVTDIWRIDLQILNIEKLRFLEGRYSLTLKYLYID